MNEAQLAEVAKLLQETDNVEDCWEKVSEILANQDDDEVGESK